MERTGTRPVATKPRTLDVPPSFMLGREQQAAREKLAAKRAQRALKRGLDIVLSAMILTLLAVPFALIALAIKIESRGPVIYSQHRAGKGGRLFTMYKFRSMVENADDLMPAIADMNEQTGPLFKIREDPRKTRVGKILRRFSLDEAPQLFNVLRGDLSLVGPRPPLDTEVLAYEPEHWRRLAVPQGMTGLWQVRGRSLLKFEDMLTLDVEYVRSWSILLDLKLLARTIPAVLSGRGAF